MALSLNNSSNVKLLSGQSFNGKYDDILSNSEINISLNTNCTYELIITFSTDKINDDYIETINVIADSLDTKFYTFIAKERYFKLKLTATSNSTFVRLQTIFKNSVSVMDVDISGQTVNIGNLPASQTINGSISLTGVGVLNESLKVHVSNVPTNYSTATNQELTNNKIDSIIANLTAGTKGVVVLWVNQAVITNDTSSVANLSSVLQNNLTIFGNSDSICNLIVQFSIDGSIFYDSQYSYSVAIAGDFGFNVQACPNYLRLKSTQNTTITAYLNYA